MFFVVYNTGALFPITNATEQVQGTNASITTVVGSPVLSATVGSEQNFSNLTEPVRVLLRLHELEVGNQDLCEKCLEYILVCVLAFNLIRIETMHKGGTTIDSQLLLHFLHRMSQICLNVSLGILILQVCTQYRV